MINQHTGKKLLFGSPNKLGFEISRLENQPLIQVDIWLNGQLITCDDNTAYLGTFKGNLRHDLERITDFSQFTHLFGDKTPEEIHQFIESTRDEHSSNYDLFDDLIYPSHQFMDWTEITDNVTAFLVDWESYLNITWSFWRADHHQPKEINVINAICLAKSDVFPVMEAVLDHLESIVE